MLVPEPADVPPQEPVYHCHVAPVPRLPPVTVSVFDVPLHVLLLLMLMLVGAVERLPTLTEREAAALVPQLLPAVTVMLPFWPALPVVTEIEVVPCPPVMLHPVGTVHVYMEALVTALILYVWLVRAGH